MGREGSFVWTEQHNELKARVAAWMKEAIFSGMSNKPLRLGIHMLHGGESSGMMLCPRILRALAFRRSNGRRGRKRSLGCELGQLGILSGRTD